MQWQPFSLVALDFSINTNSRRERHGHQELRGVKKVITSVFVRTASFSLCPLCLRVLCVNSGGRPKSSTAFARKQRRERSAFRDWPDLAFGSGSRLDLGALAANSVKKKSFGIRTYEKLAGGATSRLFLAQPHRAAMYSIFRVITSAVSSRESRLPPRKSWTSGASRVKRRPGEWQYLDTTGWPLERGECILHGQIGCRLRECAGRTGSWGNEKERCRNAKFAQVLHLCSSRSAVFVSLRMVTNLPA
jgi:hypothetical protein